jgi:hypothetical protein
MRQIDLRDERGMMIVLFAVILPLLMILTALVWDTGNWWTHRKHLQTQADAGAFAGGSAWSFPCASDADLRIVAEARKFVGPHLGGPGNQDFTGGTKFNPQIGDTPGTSIHVVLNGADWWDDDAGLDPSDATSPAGSVCEAKILDVKVTEEDNRPLFGLIPFFPDLKRRARVQIEEAEGVSGLLPIGVRIPKPVAAAAVFYDETNGVIRDVKYFCEKPNGFSGLPAGLGGWTTLDAGVSPDPMCSSWADLTVDVKTGIVIATSVRGACGTGAPPLGNPCLEDSGWVGSQVDQFCRQGSGTTQCWDATGSGSTQAVQSGVQFIRGFGNAATGTGPPQLRTVYLDSSAPAGCLGSYFSSFPSQCLARLNVKLDLGALQGTYPNPSPPGPDVVGPLRAGDVEVRFMLGRSDGSTQCNNYPNTCDVGPTDDTATGAGVTYTTSGNSSSPHLQIPAESLQNAVAIQVRVRNAINSPNPNCQDRNNFNNNCRFWWTGNGMVPEAQADQAADLIAAPAQRAFSGSVDRTGPLRWVHLVADLECDGVPELGFGGGETVEAASVPAGRNCFYLEMGLQGGVARDQDEPPIAFNLGTTGSQRAFLDCDPAAGSNLKEEIRNGCAALYQPHPFTYTPYCPNDNNPAALLGPHPPPWDASNGWPPPQCVVTQTGTGNQVMQGFNERLFGVSNNPTCPLDNEALKPGRNYWHDANNNFLDPLTGTYDTYTFAQDSPAPPRSNRLQVTKDPRYVTLFFTTFDSFASSGQETFPIVGFGGFYVTGYGRTSGGGGSWQGGAPEDPCSDGNSGALDGLPYGVGNEPPPDLNLGANQTWVWGHFLTPVFPTAGGTPSGRLCDPAAGKPCVVSLVE